MNENGRAPQSNGDFGLEEQLRLLPRPRMPAGLEERLLAAIPASRQATISGRCVAAGRSWPRPLPWAFGAVAAGALAAAAVLVAALILRRETPAPPGASRPAVASMSKEDIAAAVEREAMSAKWMASARALAFDLGSPEEARKICRYVTQTYPETAAAKQTLDFPQTQQGETQ